MPQPPNTVRERVKFYADTPNGDRNRLFTFDNAPADWDGLLYRFSRSGYKIRSAWLSLSVNGKEVLNQRVENLQFFLYPLNKGSD